MKLHRLVTLAVMLGWGVFWPVPNASAQDVLAQDVLAPVHQLAMLPVEDKTPQPALEAFLSAHWQAYFKTTDPVAFDISHIRAAMVDLNDDSVPELVLLIQRQGWETADGFPVVVAQWRKQKWLPIGWGWGDEDTLFTVNEQLNGWRSLDFGTQWLRWHGTEYWAEAKESAQ